MNRPLLGFATALLAVFLAFVAPAALAQETERRPTMQALTEDGEAFYDPATRTWHGKNGVVVRYEDITLSATEVALNEETMTASASGIVRLQQGDDLWVGEQIEYNFKTRDMNAGPFKMGTAPFFLAGTGLSAVSGDRSDTNGIYQIENGRVTTDDVEEPIYWIKAKELKIVPGEYIEAKHATIRLGDTPIMYFPKYHRSLKKHSRFWVLTPGFRTRYGAFLLTSYNFAITTNIQAAVNLDYRERRGVGLGPSLEWDYGRWGFGDAEYYYARDEDSMIDPSPFLIPRDRQRLRFSHQATLRTNFTAKVNVNHQTDPRFIRDFFESEYREDPQPKTFLELDHTWPNYELNLLAQPAIVDHFTTVERLPDLQLSAFRQQIGESPLYYQGESSAAYLKMHSASNPLTNYAAGRFDSYHQILYPHTFFGWLNFEPRVGGRFTHYSEQEGFGSALVEENRFIFNTGAETSMKASRVWSGATNRMFQVDGLRHIFNPSLNYVFVPDPTSSRGEIPQFDSEYPSLRLLPIDFPDYNAIDSVDAMNVLRMGMRNKIQTKRDGEIQNLVNWNIFTDWRMSQQAGQNTFSDGFSDLDFRPRSWLTLSSEVRYDIDDGRLRGSNHRMVVNPNDTWSVMLGHRYFDEDVNFRFGGPAANNVVYTRAYYKLNENWGFRMSHHFEARDGTLEEQYYTIYRDLRSWTAAFTIRHRDHRVGPDDFAVAITFSLKAFPRYPVGRDRNEPSFLIGG